MLREPPPAGRRRRSGAEPLVARRASCSTPAASSSGTGVVLLGPSGTGKSDLALRLIDGGARLVADDRSPSSAAATF